MWLMTNGKQVKATGGTDYWRENCNQKGVAGRRREPAGDPDGLMIVNRGDYKGRGSSWIETTIK